MKKIWTMMLACTAILAACDNKTKTDNEWPIIPPDPATQWSSVSTAGTGDAQWVRNFNAASNPDVMLRVVGNYPTDPNVTDFNISVYDNDSGTMVGSLAKADIVNFSSDATTFVVHVVPSNTSQNIIDALGLQFVNGFATGVGSTTNTIIFPDSVNGAPVNSISIQIDATYSAPSQTGDFDFGGVKLPLISLYTIQGKRIGFEFADPSN